MTKQLTVEIIALAMAWSGCALLALSLYAYNAAHKWKYLYQEISVCTVIRAFMSGPVGLAIEILIALTTVKLPACSVLWRASR